MDNYKWRGLNRRDYKRAGWHKLMRFVWYLVNRSKSKTGCWFDRCSNKRFRRKDLMLDLNILKPITVQLNSR